MGRGVVSALFVYPVKSCRGIALDRGEVEPRGLRHDRRWLMVDGAGKFVTQRTEPRLALVEVAVDEGRGVAGALARREPGELRLRAGAARGRAARACRSGATRWRRCDGGEEAARWVSALLGAPASMVFMPDDVERPVRASTRATGDHVSFADAFPLLVASVASLDDLNARLDRRYRWTASGRTSSSTGARPWAEDGWRALGVGAP